MPVLNCYVSDADMAQLQLVSKATGRSVADLAESAISEQACQSIRDYGKAGEDQPCPEYGGDTGYR